MLAYIADKGKITRLITPPQFTHIQKYANELKAQYNDKLLPELANRLIEYFAGKKVNFDDIKCDMSNLSAFAQKILLATRKIPYGSVITYRKLAESVHLPRAYRAAGNALAKNPIPIIIPCHRVIRSDGSIGGYISSNSIKNVEFKRALLKLENSLGNNRCS